MRRRGALAACAAALGLVVAAPTAARAAATDYLVGAAKVDITPPPFDAAHDEPAFATCPPVFTGLRRFRFEEPYTDSNGNGRYDFGVTNNSPPEPFCDANQNDRYDGIFLSGAIDSMATAVHDPIDVRAVAIKGKGKTYVVASVVAQGIFENYIEEMRQEAEKRRPIAGMVVSANHNESSPDTVGIYGSPEVGGVAGGRSGIDEYYMDWLVGRVADAATAAYDSMQPGSLFVRQTPLPDGLKVNLSDNFPTTYDSKDKPAAIDPKIGLLQARANGKPVFTVMSLAAHNQQIGHSELSSAPDPTHPDVKVPLNQQIGSDWPGYFHRKLERDGNAGMPMFLVGDNGSEEDPETVPAVGKLFPECLEPGSTTNTDGCYPQALATGERLAVAVADEAKSAERLPYGSMDFDRRAIYVPIENNAFKAAFAAGLFGERQGYTGSTKTGPAGKDLRTFVSVLDVGPQLQLISNPGEAFPALMLGSPFGIDEVACPNRPNPRVPTWRAHAAYRFQVGLADDLIGYEIPAWSFIEPGVFTTDECDAQMEDPKGHHHKLESEGVGPTASNAMAEASSSLVASHGVDPAAVIRPGRFVLPDGTLTRRPNGAVGVWVAESDDASALTPGKGVVVGLKGVTGFGTQAVTANGRMMDYDGVDQTGAGDVLTRGMVVFGCSGAPSKRYYLNVYPALSGPSKLGAPTHGSVGAGCGSGQPGVGTPGNPHTGPPLVGGEDHACRDRVTPRSRLSRHDVRIRRGRITLHGSASDRGCGHRLAAVLVSVARVDKRGCRFVLPNGRLGKRRNCRKPVLLRARGTRRWKLSLRTHRLRRGHYRVIVRAIDRAGNREEPKHLNHLSRDIG